jgi:hypothetical protein
MLAGLLERDHPAACELAERLLDISRLQHDTDQRAVAIDVARLLLEYAPDAGWPVLWPLVQIDSDFGRAVFESLAHGSEHSVTTRLDESQLAELSPGSSASTPTARIRHSRREGSWVYGSRLAGGATR